MSTEEKKEIETAEKKPERKLDGRGIFAICGGLTGALLVLRSYQMLKLTDFSTGFFTSPKSATVLPFYVIFALLVLLSVIITRFTDTPFRSVYPTKRNLSHGTSCILLAAAFAREVFEGFGAFAENVLRSNMTQLQYIKANKAYADIAAPVFALLAFVILVLEAIALFSGKPFTSKLRLLHLCPTMWIFTETVGYFGTTANYLKEPQFMLLIFATVFFMLFMFEYARFACGIGAKGSRKLFVGSGTVCVGLFAVLLVPELLAAIFIKDFGGVVNADFAWWQAAAPVFVLSALEMRIGVDEKTDAPAVNGASAGSADSTESAEATDSADSTEADTSADTQPETVNSDAAQAE